MPKCVLQELGIVCALGHGKEEVLVSLLGGSKQSHLPDLPKLRQHDPRFQSRNNRLLQCAVDQILESIHDIIRRYGPDRVAIVMGTSTSGIAETETAWLNRDANGKFPGQFHYGQMEIGSPSEFLSLELGITGPAYTVSTACSSSAKAILSAHRLLSMGVCDAVIAGGVDSLCQFTQAGFASLGAVSPGRCNPFSKNRRGIHIDEGAAVFLIVRNGTGVSLLGGGESSDAHHISAPRPDGLCAATAMREALANAGLKPGQIDYLNLHGTATPLNDAMEAAAVNAVLGCDVPCSSTKPLSGHALGAAGALEAAFCWLLFDEQNANGRLPPHVWDGKADSTLPALLFTVMNAQLGRPLKAVMSNSFGFGGSNVCLILGRDI